MTATSSPSPLVDPIDDPDALPRHTTPTWEVELLISGVAVFAMLQLPGWLDDRYFGLVPRLDTQWADLLYFGHLYAKMSAMTLAGTFVLHLLLRAHWIALVGMGSVYPRGILWSRLRMGAQQLRVERALTVDVASAIESADNLATIVFAVGVDLAARMLKLVLIVAILSLVMYLLGLYFATQTTTRLILFGILLAIFLPMVVASRIDRQVGDRLDPDGRAARLLRGLFGFYRRLGIGRGSNAGMLLMFSNEGHQRARVAMVAAIAAIGMVMVYQLDQAKDPTRFGNYSMLPSSPSDATGVLHPEHYDDQRDSARLGVAPFVQSQVVTDPYLKLVVAIQPSLHGAAMRRLCAHSLQAQVGEIDCLAAMHPLRLDGKWLKDAHFDLGSDPKAQRPALIAMIDLRPLGNGRHELLVGEPDQPNGEKTPPDRIAFWR